MSKKLQERIEEQKRLAYRKLARSVLNVIYIGFFAYGYIFDNLKVMIAFGFVLVFSDIQSLKEEINCEKNI